MTLTHYVKVSLRCLLKQKMFSFISISSLAVGMAVFILFLQMFRSVLSMDMFHRNADRIFTVVEVFGGGGQGDRHRAYTPVPLPMALKNEIPEIEDVTRILGLDGCILRHGDQSFMEGRGLAVDPNLLSVFSFPVLSGDPKTMLSSPNSIVLTKSLAVKYFGAEPALGKTLTLEKEVDLVVSGVMADSPPQSTISYSFLVPLDIANALHDLKNDWSTSEVSSFVLLKENCQPSMLVDKLSAFRRSHFPNAASSPSSIYLYPLPDMFFRPEYLQAINDSDSLAGHFISLAMGILFLVVVCVNHMNLVTAKYTDRLKEVGVRKSVGAGRGHLVQQFLGESIFYTLLALPLALLLYQVYCPYVLRIIGDDVELSIWRSPSTIFLLLGIAILVGVLSGSYPALFLSRFKPVQILKGKTGTGSRGRLRKSLVVFQFSMSIVFIVFALTVKKRSEYAFSMNTGYDRENIIAILMPGDARPSQQLISEEMKSNSSVSSVSACMGIPGSWRGAECSVVPEGSDETSALKMNTFGVRHDFLKVMGMKILTGRDFSGDQRDESSLIINRLAAERLGGETAIGRAIRIGERSGSVIGIVDNFLFNSCFSQNAPGILFVEQQELSCLLVKVSSDRMIPAVKSSLMATWKNHNPGLPFDAFTLDEHLVELEDGRQKASVILGAIGVAAIFFSALGLFGLVSYSVSQRTKEIGVRKILGASMGEIVALLGRSYMFLMIVSNLIGLPIAYLLARLFLTINPIRPSLGPGMFIFVSSITFLAAMSALVFQVLRGARANPVESLRYE